MEFSRQEYWSGFSFPPQGSLSDPGIEPMSLAAPALQADSLPLSHRGSCVYICMCVCIYIYMYIYIYTHTHRILFSHKRERHLAVYNNMGGTWEYFSSVWFSNSVMSDSLWSHGLQHARLPCPSQTPGACSNSCPLSQWCHPNISSSVIPFSSCLQYFPASGSFPMS